MPVLFVIDRSDDVPSKLVQRLLRDGFHTLSLADCHAALGTLRCLIPKLVIVDVRARSCAAAEGLLKLLAGRDPDKPSVPVMVIGATMNDYRALAGQLKEGEIVPAACSSVEEIVRRVTRYIRPSWPTLPALRL
jgi:DNA-binding NtrC family response regulator